MTINYTTNLSLAEPVTGTESGTWGDDVNKGLTDYLDIAIAGTLALTSSSFTANALTLANTTGNNSSNGITTTTAQYYVLKVSSLAANVTITAPSSSKSYIVVNNDPTYTVTIKASGQTGVTVAVSSRALVVFNGTDYQQVGASAGGSTTQVQYNNAGALAGSANFTYSSTGLSLTGYSANTSTSVGFLNVGAGGYSNSFSGQVASFSGADTTNVNVSLTNTNSGATSYAAYAVGGNSYGSTYYMEIGSNSSTYSYTSAGYPNNAFSAAYANFIEAGGGDLAIGTWSSNAIHFIVNGSTATTDAMTINTSGAIAVNGSYGTTNYVLTSQGNGSPPVWAAPAATGVSQAKSTMISFIFGF